MPRYDTQIDGVNFVSLLGSADNAAPVPRWRSTLTLDWSRGPWGATLARLQPRLHRPVARPRRAARQVGPTTQWDLQLRQRLAGWRWSLGVQNLFDRDPPASNQQRTAQPGYNPQLSSPLGRTFYLRGTREFD